MTPAERHKRAAQIFDQALLLAEPAALDGFLSAECSGDSELRQRVERMLKAEREAPSEFMERPALQAAARMLATDTKRPVTGTTIGGNYLAGKQIGAGGMGTVYEAQDLRLNRPVALKILPDIYVADADRVRRFEQEARAASLLNHPNIVSIHDAGLDQATGLHYIAIELVQGKTLREILRGGRMDQKDLIEVAIQICSALSAAHQAGIVHRDIKPENVMVRPDGIVKVLDFGLAKLLDSGLAAAASDGPNARVSHTRHGNIAGTVHYLSPEQVLGKATGPRSDLFSLGIVLYELCTGERPFQGPTDGAIFESILHTDPAPPSQLVTDVSAGFEQAILHCLEKDPELRYQSAGDLRAALKRLDRDSRSSYPGSSGSAASTPGARTLGASKPAVGFRLVPVLAAVAATAVVFAAAGIWWKRQSDSQLDLRRQPVAFERLTADPHEELHPSLTADGSQFVYASAKSGNWDIYLQRTGGQTAVNLTSEYRDDDTEPSISPDGKRIAFRSTRGGGGIFVMEITGENPKRLSARGFHPSWSPDGKKLVAAASGFVNPSRVAAREAPLLILDPVDGSEKALKHPRLGLQPVWSPNGHRIAFWALPDDTGRRDVLTVSADGNSPPVAVTHDEALDWNPVWSPDGRQLYFISDRGGTMNLWRVAIDEKTGALQSAPEPVTAPSLYTKHASLAANGETFAFVRAEQFVGLFSMNLDPATQRLTSQPVRVGDATTSIAGFNFSPDETRVAFDNLGDPQEDLWIMNIDGTGRRRLTNDLAKDRDPSWSPDGKLLVFYSDRDGKNYNIWSIATDGSGLRRRTDVADRVFAMSPIFTHDGSRIIYFPWTRPPSWLPGDGPVHKGIPTVLPGFENMGDIYLQPFNPSGPEEADHFLGDERTSTGRELIRYDLKRARAERLGAKGTIPAWLPGQKQLLFARGGKLMHFDLATKAERELLSVFPNDIWNLHVTRDGRRVYFTSTVREGDIWLGRFRR